VSAAVPNDSFTARSLGSVPKNECCGSLAETSTTDQGVQDKKGKTLLLGLGAAALIAASGPAKAQVTCGVCGGGGDTGQATSAAAHTAKDTAKASGGNVGAAVSEAVRSEKSQGRGPKK
jgi:hypothetical protein